MIRAEKRYHRIVPEFRTADPGSDRFPWPSLLEALGTFVATRISALASPLPYNSIVNKVNVRQSRRMM